MILLLPFMFVWICMILFLSFGLRLVIWLVEMTVAAVVALILVIRDVKTGRIKAWSLPDFKDLLKP